MNTRSLAVAAVTLAATLVADPSSGAAAERCAGAVPDVLGTNRADVLRGTPGDDVIAGLGGNDRIDGLGLICGGAGDDDLRSSAAGSANVWGGPGNDDIYLRGEHDAGVGESGDDFITASARYALLDGGAGDDTLLGSAYDDSIDGGPGDDDIDASGGDDRHVTDGAGADRIDGGPGDDVLLGQAGNDRMFSGPGAGQLRGGPGADTILVQGDGVVTRGEGGDDDITGSRYRDDIDGGAGDDQIRAMAGDDRDIHGGPGDDSIHGGSGGDDLKGDAGFDTIWTDGNGGRGVDYAKGDAGTDVLIAGSDWSVGVGGDDNDVLSADAAHVSLFGQEGDDLIVGDDDPTRADGGPGNDRIRLGDKADTDVHGGPGDDQIDGGGGDDVIHADDGNDVCNGGAGADTCHGGSPGGPENTPTDPDICGADVEEKTSCREAGMPSRWKVTLSGTTTYDPNPQFHSETVWSVTGFIDAYWSQDGSHWYMPVSGVSGTWSATGRDDGQGGDCVISGSGELGEDALSMTLRLDEPTEEYGFEWGGITDTVGTISCKSWGGPEEIHSEVSDGVTKRHWDTTDPMHVLTGSTTTPDGDATYSWTLTPLE